MSNQTDVRGVDVAGPAEAPELLFVHGVLFTRKQWAPQREALSEEFRVVAPDLPGHGVRSGEPFQMERALQVVDEAVERAADGQAHVVGLSLGGYVATMYAQRYPEKVESLVVADSCANPTGVLGTLTRAVSRVSNAATESRLVRRAVDWVAGRWVRSRNLPDAIEREIVDARFFPGQFGKAGLELAGTDFRALFATYRGPALVLNGQWDLVMRLGEDDHAAAGDARAEVIDGAGHTSNLDEPGAFAEAVRRFVRTEVATGADRR
ncbi:alpha/beta hydrolase [Halobacteriales archaeon QS_1_68_20]|nr:MAG: alpha/beta hydrolase [Halobacteriales archaeon QS_1_68_20]